MSTVPAVVSRPARRAGRDPRAVWRELRILLRFRLSAGGRDPRRTVAGIVVLVLGLGVVLPVAVAAWAPRGYVNDVLLLSPTLWTFVLVAGLIASFASAGGRELLPRRDSVAFPVGPQADQLGALVLTPLNLAWTAQAVAVLCASGYVVGLTPALPTALLAAVLWLVTATALAQLVGWLAELARTYRVGPVTLRASAVALGVLSLLVVSVGDVTDLLDRLPTTRVYVASVAASWSLYLGTQVVVVVVGAAAVLLAFPLGRLLERRPQPVEAVGETRPRSRRPTADRPVAAALRLDFLSITRSPPLRRGLTLLLMTPVAVALLLPLPWIGIVVMPALVTSGAALLHGVNVVALDGRGAVWRESLPHRPDATLVGRLAALAVVCGGSAGLLALLAGLRTGAPTPAELTATVVAVLVATLQVVSRCARWSLAHPYPADLRRGRDTPAPPVAMAAYSVRLSAATTVGALLVGTGVALQSASLSVAVGCALAIPSLLRLRTAFRHHTETSHRSRVAATVAGS